jgi:hypothetical protein
MVCKLLVLEFPFLSVISPYFKTCESFMTLDPCSATGLEKDCKKCVGTKVGSGTCIFMSTVVGPVCKNATDISEGSNQRALNATDCKDMNNYSCS